MAQGIGWALYEGLVFDDQGQLLTSEPDGLRAAEGGRHVPQIEDRCSFESRRSIGAYGSKGVGEPPAIPGPAAIANAIRHATGARVDQLPMKAGDRSHRRSNGSRGQFGSSIRHPCAG